MTMREFLQENREELDKAILRACPGVRLNMAERLAWVLNDEGLYLWAKRSGVKV